jgi:hypothetical protein
MNEERFSETKIKLLGKYAEREPKTFIQLDGWACGPGAYDSEMHFDADGYAVMGGVTGELMWGTDCRVLIPPSTKRAAAAVLLRRMAEWLERAAGYPSGFDEDPAERCPFEPVCSSPKEALEVGGKAA